MYHYAGNNPIKYTDPDGRIFTVSTDYFITTPGEKFEEHHVITKKVTNIDVSAVEHISFIGCMKLNKAEQQNFLKKLAKELNIANDVISGIGLVNDVFELGLITDPVVAATVWFVATIINEIAEQPAKNATKILSTIGDFGNKLSDVTGVDLLTVDIFLEGGIEKLNEKFAELNENIIYISFTQTIDNVTGLGNVNREAKERDLYTKKTFTLQAIAWNPEKHRYEWVESSVEIFE